MDDNLWGKYSLHDDNNKNKHNYILTNIILKKNKT